MQEVVALCELSHLMTKTNKMTVPSEDSDQTGRMEDSDQTGHPPSLIRVLAVRSMGS